MKETMSKWIPCPICGGKTRVKVYADTVMFNFPLFCPKCKKEVRVDVMQLKMANKQMSQMKNAEPASQRMEKQALYYSIGIVL